LVLKLAIPTDRKPNQRPFERYADAERGQQRSSAAGSFRLPIQPSQFRLLGWESAWLFDAAAAAQVGIDLKPRAAAEAGTVDLQILQDPLHVIPRLGERD
jgi:hypothetical protein